MTILCCIDTLCVVGPSGLLSGRRVQNNPQHTCMQVLCPGRNNTREQNFFGPVSTSGKRESFAVMLASMSLCTRIIRGTVCTLHTTYDTSIIMISIHTTVLVRIRFGILFFRFRKKIQPVLCAVKMGEDQTALTGTVSGHLYYWKASMRDWRSHETPCEPLRAPMQWNPCTTRNTCTLPPANIHFYVIF